MRKKKEAARYKATYINIQLSSFHISKGQNNMNCIKYSVFKNKHKDVKELHKEKVLVLPRDIKNIETNRKAYHSRTGKLML